MECALRTIAEHHPGAKPAVKAEAERSLKGCLDGRESGRVAAIAAPQAAVVRTSLGLASIAPRGLGEWWMHPNSF